MPQLQRRVTTEIKMDTGAKKPRKSSTCTSNTCRKDITETRIRRGLVCTTNLRHTFPGSTSPLIESTSAEVSREQRVVAHHVQTVGKMGRVTVQCQCWRKSSNPRLVRKSNRFRKDTRTHNTVALWTDIFCGRRMWVRFFVHFQEEGDCIPQSTQNTFAL